MVFRFRALSEEHVARAKLLYLVSGILALSGLGIFAYKVYLGFPLTPKSVGRVWNVEVRLNFPAHDGPAHISMFIPRSSRGFAVLDEKFISNGCQWRTVSESGNRKVIWSISGAGREQTLYYRAVVRAVRTRAPRTEVERPDIVTRRLGDAHLAAANALIAETKDQSADTFSFVAQLMQRLNQAIPDTNVQFLLGRDPSLFKIVDMAVRLLGQAGIPARMVRGLHLDSSQSWFPRKTAFVAQLHVYENGQWWLFDPVSGQVALADTWFPWWRGSETFLQSEGVTKPRAIVSASPKVEEAISAAVMRREIADPVLLKVSLLGLPVNTQAIYRVILLIPVGALVLALLRNIVGLRTYGTFMPVLIALAFHETGLLWGAFVFVVIIVMGLTVRFYLERLKLLVVPRLCAVLIVVIFSMAILSIIMHSLGIHAGLSVALFPMVILTMTIERMSISWEEEGPRNAIIAGVGSLLAAALIFIVINTNEIEHLVFAFPELMLVLLGVVLLLGRYSGYRLMDLYRFRALAQN